MWFLIISFIVFLILARIFKNKNVELETLGCWAAAIVGFISIAVILILFLLFASWIGAL